MPSKNRSGRHRITEEDLRKRRGDRRLLALRALAQASLENSKAKQSRDRRVAANPPAPWLTPVQLAEMWSVHPTSAFRVLERLRKARRVVRTGLGQNAQYAITEEGAEAIKFLSRRSGRKNA